MRALLVATLAATAALASASIILPSDANAEARHQHHRVHVAPHVGQNPYQSFNTFGPPKVTVDPVDTYRWPPSGGAT